MCRSPRPRVWSAGGPRRDAAEPGAGAARRPARGRRDAQRLGAARAAGRGELGRRQLERPGRGAAPPARRAAGPLAARERDGVDGLLEYAILWQDWPVEDATWENAEEIKKTAPNAVKEHVIINSDQYSSYDSVRDKLTSYREATANESEGPFPMELDAITHKGKGKGSRKEGRPQQQRRRRCRCCRLHRSLLPSRMGRMPLRQRRGGLEASCAALSRRAPRLAPS